MLVWKNRYAFSKPNRKSKFLYLFIILLVLYIALIYFLLVFNLICCINLIYIITTSSISNIINHFHCVMLTFLINLCLICIKPIILRCMSNININKKITCCTLDIQKPIQIKPHIFGSDRFEFF